MIVIAAVDDRMGMLFHKRRLSQDRVLRKKMLERVKQDGKKLWMNSYSMKQFSKDADILDLSSAIIHTDEDFLLKTPEGDYCFVEDKSVSGFEERMEKVILVKWNRCYPADLYWDLDLSGWKKECTGEFPGFSHEKITLEEYVR